MPAPSADKLLAALLAATAAACATSGIERVRFRNQPPVWEVADRAPIPKPREREFHRETYFYDMMYYRAVLTPLEVPYHRPAMDINALGEVPDSTWFTNRVGHRPMSLGEIARGPGEDAAPSTDAPWTVVGSKVGGAAPGFTIEDARGVRYILKFDKAAYPEYETGADAVVQRLLWAFGYHTPNDTVVQFSRSQLVAGEDATFEREDGERGRLTAAVIDDVLADAYRDERGRYRGLASRYLDGVPRGGFAQTGTRRDDPNDTIPHQHRRSLRGLKLAYAWLQCTDIKTDNTLDMWRDGHLVHYLVDFGKCLGVNGHLGAVGDGYIHNKDFGWLFPSLISFGLWRRPWEGMTESGIPGVGVFDVEHFAPGAFKARWPYYTFDYAEPEDMYWAATKIIAFSEAQIRAAVEQGKYSDARAVDYLTRTLVARARKAARYWFQRVTPLDDFAVVDGRLCFRDLLVAHDLVRGAAAKTRYAARAYDYAAERVAWRGAITVSAPGVACTAALPALPARDGYTIVELRVRRGDDTLAPVFVHLARAPDRTLRVIGIRR